MHLLRITLAAMRGDQEIFPMGLHGILFSADGTFETHARHNRPSLTMPSDGWVGASLMRLSAAGKVALNSGV